MRGFNESAERECPRREEGRRSPAQPPEIPPLVLERKEENPKPKGKTGQNQVGKKEKNVCGSYKIKPKACLSTIKKKKSKIISDFVFENNIKEKQSLKMCQNLSSR